jgi:hypothetical protein
MGKKIVGLLVALVVGGVFLGIGFHLYKQKRKVESYVETVGTVLRSEVTSHQKTSTSGSGRNRHTTTTTMYTPEIRYCYEVYGVTYEGSKYSYLGKTSSSSRGWAEKIVRQYPDGVSCTVYYDAGEPSQSVLVRKATGFSAWLPTVLIGVGALVLLLAGGGGLFWVLVLMGVLGSRVLAGRAPGAAVTDSSEAGDIPELQDIAIAREGGEKHAYGG